MTDKEPRPLADSEETRTLTVTVRSAAADCIIVLPVSEQHSQRVGLQSASELRRVTGVAPARATPSTRPYPRGRAVIQVTSTGHGHDHDSDLESKLIAADR